MNIIQTLNENLLKQPFVKDNKENAVLKSCRQIAFIYSKIENSIAVLSDLKSNHSDIFYGGFSKRIFEKGNRNEDISRVLCISKNTVSRHRQNILSKLRVKNSFEACRIARLMRITL